MGIATVQGVGANQSDPPSTTPDLAVADKAGADKAGPTKQKETPPQPFLVGEGLPTSSETGCKNLEGRVLWTWWSCSGIILMHVTHGREGSSGGQMPNRVTWREGPNLLSCLQCFRMNATVFCEKNSQRKWRISGIPDVSDSRVPTV